MSDPCSAFPRPAVEQPIHRRFEQMARCYPDRAAILGTGPPLSYTEVDRMANLWAHAVLAAGPGEPGDRVAILMEKGAPVIIACLGALKAGRVYCCLDPSLPGVRLRELLDHAGASAVLCDGKNLERARALAGPGVAVVQCDELPPGLPDTVPEVEVDPGAVAYIIYTSGSMGRPKGVFQSHRNAIHYTRNYSLGVGLGPGDRLSILGSFSFGAATMDMLAGLLNGAAVLPYDLKAGGLSGLREVLRRERLTVYHSVPSLLRKLMWSLSPDDRFPDLRIIDLGGEVVWKRDVEAFKRHFAPGCVLVNGLGCTELNVIRQFHVRHDTPVPSDPIPVGAPVEDTEVLLLDAAGSPVAPGDVGEIVVRSRYSALGYWNMPEETAGRFGPDADEPADRRFHTGDLGYMLPSGDLVVVGRKDNQVKIRGFRVEPGEVENALAQHPGVKDVAVKAIGDGAGGAMLVAWLEARGKDVPDSRELRAFALDRLPDYMVPAIFVTLTELPTTPTGKLDRKALPMPETDRPEVGDPELASSTQARLSAIWRQIVPLAPGGSHEDFFSLGGDSLGVMQLNEQIRRELGVEIPLRALFENATLEAQTRIIEELRVRGGAKDRIHPAWLAGRSTRRAPLTLAQEPWFRLPVPNAWRACELLGPLDEPALRAALRELLRRQRILTGHISLQGGVPWNETSGDPGWALPRADFASAEDPVQASAWLEAGIEAPFDLENGPLFRVFLLKLGPERHWFAWVVHHLVFDGLSWDILWREISELYAAFHKGSTASGAGPGIQFTDIAAWEHEAPEAQAQRASALAYWTERLRGRPRVAIPGFRAAGRGISVTSPAITAGTIEGASIASLERLTHDHRASRLMVLMAAYVVLLARYTGVEDLTVDVPLAGRNRPECKGLVGCFARDVAVRCRVSRRARLGEVIEQVRDECLAAYAHQEISLSTRLPAADGHAGPEFPFNFRMRPAPLAELRLEGLRTSPLTLPRTKPGPSHRWVQDGFFGHHGLVLDVVESPHGLALRLISRHVVPGPAELGALLQSYRSILAGMNEEPHRTLMDLPLDLPNRS